MTIDELKQKKQELEIGIEKLIKNFENECKVNILEISVKEKYTSVNGESIKEIKTEMRI